MAYVDVFHVLYSFIWRLAFINSSQFLYSQMLTVVYINTTKDQLLPGSAILLLLLLLLDKNCLFRLVFGHSPVLSRHSGLNVLFSTHSEDQNTL